MGQILTLSSLFFHRCALSFWLLPHVGLISIGKVPPVPPHLEGSHHTAWGDSAPPHEVPVSFITSTKYISYAASVVKVILKRVHTL